MAGRAVAGRGARGIARFARSFSVDTDGSMDLEMIFASLREDAPGQPATKLARLSSRDRDPSPPSSLDRECEEFNRELEEIFGSPMQNSSSSTDQTSSVPAIDSKPSRAPPTSLTHVDSSGHASMVDVSNKTDTKRNAVASGRVLLGPEVFQLVAANKIAKGDVLTVAKIAGIQAAKQTSTLIPLCHTIALSSVDVKLALDEEETSVEVTAEASSVGPTGVEMEALTAVSVACLTVYDMCKAASKGIQISGIGLVAKSGGKSGDWHREQN